MNYNVGGGGAPNFLCQNVIFPSLCHLSDPKLLLTCPGCFQCRNFVGSSPLIENPLRIFVNFPPFIVTLQFFVNSFPPIANSSQIFHLPLLPTPPYLHNSSPLIAKTPNLCRLLPPYCQLLPDLCQLLSLIFANSSSVFASSSPNLCQFLSPLLPTRRESFLSPYCQLLLILITPLPLIPNTPNLCQLLSPFLPTSP